MDLMEEAIGIKRLISQSTRPTITNVMITVNKGVIVIFLIGYMNSIKNCTKYASANLGKLLQE
jgi:hypothetical protein